MSQLETLQQHFHTLRMPTAVQVVEETISTAQKENWSLETFLSEVLEQEIEGRRLRRIEHLKKAAHLPVEKKPGDIQPRAFTSPDTTASSPTLHRRICRSHREFTDLWFAWQRKDSFRRSDRVRTTEYRAQRFLYPNLPPR